MLKTTHKNPKAYNTVYGEILKALPVASIHTRMPVVPAVITVLHGIGGPSQCSKSGRINDRSECWKGRAKIHIICRW